LDDIILYFHFRIHVHVGIQPLIGRKNSRIGSATDGYAVVEKRMGRMADTGNTGGGANVDRIWII